MSGFQLFISDLAPVAQGGTRLQWNPRSADWSEIRMPLLFRGRGERRCDEAWARPFVVRRIDGYGYRLGICEQMKHRQRWRTKARRG